MNHERAQEEITWPEGLLLCQEACTPAIQFLAAPTYLGHSNLRKCTHLPEPLAVLPKPGDMEYTALLFCTFGKLVNQAQKGSESMLPKELGLQWGLHAAGVLSLVAFSSGTQRAAHSLGLELGPETWAAHPAVSLHLSAAAPGTPCSHSRNWYLCRANCLHLCPSHPPSEAASLLTLPREASLSVSSCHFR